MLPVGQGKNPRKKKILFYFYRFRIDSIMLLEEGFEVVSVDASDKMLKHALKARWNRRNEKAFNNWSKKLNNIFLFFLCINNFSN